MGDARRFDLFAKFIARQGFSQDTRIGDIASGKGYLQCALREQGFVAIESWEARPGLRKRGTHRRQRFDYRTAPRGYALVVGMHPDEATDHIIAYAAKHRVPFVVCPCCVKPSASVLHGKYTYATWINHLRLWAERQGFCLSTSLLPMQGRNIILKGMPR